MKNVDSRKQYFYFNQMTSVQTLSQQISNQFRALIGNIFLGVFFFFVKPENLNCRPATLEKKDRKILKLQNIFSFLSISKKVCVVEFLIRQQAVERSLIILLKGNSIAYIFLDIFPSFWCMNFKTPSVIASVMVFRRNLGRRLQLCFY